MKNRESKIIILTGLAIILLVVSLGGYWTLNKEQITLSYEGKNIKVSTFKKSIRELLDENDIEYDENDKIYPALDTEVKDYMKVKVVKVDIKKEVEYDKIPFDTKVVEDKNLSKGKTKIKQDGEYGEKTTNFELIYEDGKLVEKKLVSQSISKEPVDKVVNKGIKEEMIVASRGQVTRNGNSKYMKVVATAYAGDTITATGTKPKWGTIAVDPKIIPYGTKVYIPQFDMTFTAEDCGGAIKGNKIDIFMMSESQCYNWGRRTIDIYILK